MIKTITKLEYSQMSYRMGKSKGIFWLVNLRNDKK
jgi:hypothetical protein